MRAPVAWRRSTPTAIWKSWQNNIVMAADRAYLSLKPDEVALFRAAVKDARPIASQGRIVPVPALPPAIPRSLLRDEQNVLADSLSDHIAWDDGVESGEELVFLRPGLRRDTLRKMRRGHWVLQAELDLHGMVSTEARLAVTLFLANCRKRDVRCVRIIHGKGLGSKNREGVLRTKVKSWLMQKDEVLAFCQARAVDGGSGAVIVLLKSV
ncbi:MAG: Smr/MutS family protein [Burkholderiales bacterium]